METKRLTMRPPEPADAPALFAFMGDRQVMQFTGVQTSLGGLRDYLAVHEAQRERVGYAPWTLMEKASGRLVGFGGLYEDPFDPGWGVEVAYFFHPAPRRTSTTATTAPAAWGRGYATELVAFCIEEARRNALWPRLRAFAHPDNVASQRVLLRAGFEEERFVAEMNRRLYGLDLTA